MLCFECIPRLRLCQRPNNCNEPLGLPVTNSHSVACERKEWEPTATRDPSEVGCTSNTWIKHFVENMVNSAVY